MRESDIVRKIRKHLGERYGATAHKYHGGPYGETGAADLFGTLPGGRAFYFEAKQPGKKPTPWQTAWLEEERKRGAVVGVVTSVEDVDKLLKTL